MNWLRPFATLGIAVFAVSCQSLDKSHHVLVSVAEQKMVLLEEGKPVATYPISTSKFGLGDEKNSYRTPTGRMAVAKKIGCKAPEGAVFKSREWTGEVLAPDAPGRDPILTRILWLRGLEARNRNAFPRMIYIHGTTEERNLGQPVSFGCIRMSSKDVIDLYDRIGVGAQVYITENKLPLAIHTSNLMSRIRLPGIASRTGSTNVPREAIVPGRKRSAPVAVPAT